MTCASRYAEILRLYKIAGEFPVDNVSSQQCDRRMTFSAKCNKIIDVIIWISRSITKSINMMNNNTFCFSTELASKIISLGGFISISTKTFFEFFSVAFLVTLLACTSWFSTIHTWLWWPFTTDTTKTLAYTFFRNMLISCFLIFALFFLETFLTVFAIFPLRSFTTSSTKTSVKSFLSNLFLSIPVLFKMPFTHCSIVVNRFMTPTIVTSFHNLYPFMYFCVLKLYHRISNYDM